jgi:hypothetical protein
MTRLKVWHSSFGTEARIVATPTKRAAAEAFGMSLYEFDLYASETANADSVAVALASPGVLFVRPNRRYDQPWERKPL